MTAPQRLTGLDDPFQDLVPQRRAADLAGPADAFADLVPRRRATDLDALRTALQGATLGFSDELRGLGEGVVRAAVPGGVGFREGFVRGRDAERRNLAQTRQVVGNKTATSLELFGSTPAVLTGGITRVARPALRLGARIAQGAKTGALFGGLFSAGKAEGAPTQQVVAAGLGTAVGAGLGGLTPVAASGTKATTDAITRLLRRVGRGPRAPSAVLVPEPPISGSPDLGAEVEALPASVTGAAGSKLVLAALEREGLSPSEALGRLVKARAAGISDVALPDVGGPQVRSLVDLAATRPGAAQGRVRRFTETRAGSVRQGLADALDQQVGLPRTNLHALRTTLLAARRDAANELFEPVFQAVPLVDDPAVIQAVTRVESASPRFPAFARQLARLHQVPEGQLVAEGASPAAQQLMAKGASAQALARLGFQVGQTRTIPSLRYVHFLKEAVDRDIGREMALATRGGSASRLSGLQNLKAELRDATTAAVPQYGAALEQYAGDSEMLRAIELGRRLLWANTDAVELATSVQAMTSAERDVFRAAGAAAVRSFVQGRAPLAPSPTSAWWNNPATRQKLGLLFERPEGLPNFLDALAVTRQKVLTGQAGGNSLTAQRLLAEQDLEQQIAAGVTPGDIPIVGGVTPRLVRAGLRRLEARAKARAVDQALPFLTTTGPELDDLLRRLATERLILGQQNARATLPASLIGGAVGRASGLLTEGRP